jgi:hypothetical protein
MSDDDFQEKKECEADNFWEPGVEAINGIEVSSQLCSNTCRVTVLS